MEVRNGKDAALVDLKPLKKYLPIFTIVNPMLKKRQYFKSVTRSKEDVVIQSCFSAKYLTLNSAKCSKSAVFDICTEYINALLEPYFVLLQNQKAVLDCIQWLQTLKVKEKKIEISPLKTGPRVIFRYKISDQKFRSTINVMKPYRRILKNKIKIHQETIRKEQDQENAKAHSSSHYGDLVDCEMIALVQIAHQQNKNITESSAVKIMRGLKLQSNWYDSVQKDFQARWGKCNFAYIPSNIMTDRFRAIERDRLIQSRTKRGEYGSFEVFKPTPLGIKIYEASKNEKKADKSEYVLVKELQIFHSKDLSQNVDALSQLIEKPAVFCVCQKTAQKIVARYPERCKAYLEAMAKVEQDKPDRKKVINILKNLANDKIKKKARKS